MSTKRAIIGIPRKKRSQQTRVYLGVKDPKTGEVLTPRKDKWKKCESNVSGVMYAVELGTHQRYLPLANGRTEEG